MDQTQPHQWTDLIRHSLGEPFVVEQVRFKNTGIQLRGEFELPPIACLSTDEQVFIIAFLKHHGSLKKMASLYGLSYPTIKAKLQKISDKMQLADFDEPLVEQPDDILDRLESGAISAKDAVAALREEQP